MLSLGISVRCSVPQLLHLRHAGRLLTVQATLAGTVC